MASIHHSIHSILDIWFGWVDRLICQIFPTDFQQLEHFPSKLRLQKVLLSAEVSSAFLDCLRGVSVAVSGGSALIL